MACSPSTRRLVALGCERIFPTQPREAAEVSVCRAKDQAVLDGERGKMRIRHQRNESTLA